MSKKVYDEGRVIGSYEMRQFTMDHIASWVDDIYERLELEFGEDDTLTFIGMVSFDWEFVPELILGHVDWNRDFTDVQQVLPDPHETVAKLIALRAMGRPKRQELAL